MATESPIRMVESRGKWTSHKEPGSFSSAAKVAVNEEVLPGNGQKYSNRRGIIPNRSGSAPPNMEGSLAAIESLMQNSVINSNLTSLSYDLDSRGPGGKLGSNLSFNMNYSPTIGSNPQIRQSGNQLRLASLRGSSDHLFHLSRDFLPTHKEESEDDRSPQKSSDYVANKNQAVLSGQESSLSMDQAFVAPDLTKDELTCMSSPANDKSNALPHASLGDESNSNDADSPSLQRELTAENQTSVSGDVDVTSLQSRFRALKVSCPPNLEYHGGRGERPHNLQGNLLPHQVVHQTGNFHFQGLVPQVASQGTSNSYIVGNQYFHGGRFPSPEVQPVLHSSGFTPPLYATAAATYMHSTSPYCLGAQPPGVFYPSQYGMGGYPYMAGYLPHTTTPLAFDGVSTSSDVNAQVPGSWGSNTQGFDVQQATKFHGQLGFSPTSVDPRFQFHQTFGDPYNVPGQTDPLTLRGGVTGNQMGAFDHRPQHLGVGVQNNVSQIRGVISGADYPGNSVNMAFYLPYPNSALTSPILPGSPIGGNSLVGGRSDVCSPNSGRSAGFYGGWRGERGFENVNQQKPYSFLEELKSGKGRRFELSDIAGHVVEFSIDQHGSRFIQQKLENCSVEEKASVFQEVVPHACKLMTDVFGNYVVQKFFEYGTPDQRRDLAKALAGQILPLSLQMYGCRVIQKALDVIELEQKIELVRELDGHVMRCVRDQNGNHVIQKCIECVPSQRIDFVISAFRGQIAGLSMHPYGCRVIQRVLEHCTDELQCQFIVEEILESVCTLAQDQYGNYVTQHVLERGKPRERSQIIKNLCGQVVKMSQHKFASNVVEKCLEYGDAPSRELITSEVVGEIDGTDNLLVMMKDQYANYVVQKILENCAESQRELLIERVKVHLNALKKYTYGKHIVARFEQLFGEMSASTS